MNYHNLEDYELVKQFQAGDQKSFEELIHRYRSKIYTYILLTVKNTELAEDIFQDTFIKVIKSLKNDKYAHQGRFVSWVVRIAHNLIIDYYRKANNNKTYSHEERELDLFNNKEHEVNTIEDDMISSQIAKEIKSLVNTLPHDQREVVILRHYVGLSFKEIADETGVSINTALGRMRYALINLRKLIKEKNLNLTYL